MIHISCKHLSIIFFLLFYVAKSHQDTSSHFQQQFCFVISIVNSISLTLAGGKPLAIKTLQLIPRNLKVLLGLKGFTISPFSCGSALTTLYVRVRCPGEILIGCLEPQITPFTLKKEKDGSLLSSISMVVIFIPFVMLSVTTYEYSFL